MINDKEKKFLEFFLDSFEDYERAVFNHQMGDDLAFYRSRAVPWGLTCWWEMKIQKFIILDAYQGFEDIGVYEYHPTYRTLELIGNDPGYNTSKGKSRIWNFLAVEQRRIRV